jgi:nicotinate dehydrogenase subunit B
LFLDPGAIAQADPARSALWNRGAYLVDGLGHCGGCHTPRNALGAERSGRAYLSGAMVDGWEAPALTAAAPSPVPWTEVDLYDYLRAGHSVRHGSASGPMAAVVRELAAVGDDDLRAMAHYLASFQPAADAAAAQEAAASAIARGQAVAPAMLGPAQRMFDQACGACHHDGDGPRLLGVNIPLALNTNLHGDRPDNLIRVILEGVREPATREIGFMPAFDGALDDRQIAELVHYLRRRFAPDRPPWRSLEATVAKLRATAPTH